MKNHYLNTTGKKSLFLERLIFFVIRPAGCTTLSNKHAFARLHIQFISLAFILYIESAPRLEYRLSPALPFDMQRSSLEDAQNLDDGPLFRATLKQLESHTGSLKQSVKHILKAATAALEAKKAMLDADAELLTALRGTSATESLFASYLDEAWPIIHEQRQRLQHSMQSLLIDPLQKLYDLDIKRAEARRRQFEDESKEYYTYLGKYLSIKNDDKKLLESDAKYSVRKRRFDLMRFDYYSFLLDLHGGKKEYELLYHVLSHQQKEYHCFQTIAAALNPLKVGLDDIAQKMIQVSRDQDQLHKDRQEKRKLLETRDNASVDQLSVDDPSANEEITDDGTLWADDEAAATSADKNRVSTGTSVASTERRKEGFLFATTKPQKPTTGGVTWHKYWCVLSAGQLHEYSNWKRHLETHIDPINLRFATVREARQTDRRFCFEVITPYLRRTYQAISHEEMLSWMATINNAIESLLNGMSSSVDMLKNMQESDLEEKEGSLALRPLSAAICGGISPKERKRIAAQLSVPHSGSLSIDSAESSTTVSERLRWSGLSFGGSVNTAEARFSYSSTGKYVPLLPSDAIANTRLLTELRMDSSNLICADCDAKNPEWCSLNLGVLLCIECSGIHRSLGTHISKIRSLTLDSTSYTPDIVELLRSMGNDRSNQIWDKHSHSKDKSHKPTPTDSREVKLQYIQAKYVDRMFVNKKDDNVDPAELLYDAIERDHIPDAIHAIALGADVNLPRPISRLSKRISLLQDDLTIFSIPEEPFTDTEKKNDRSPSKAIDDIYVVRYPLHFALLHPRDVIPLEPTSPNEVEDDAIRIHVFPMAELLLQNGADGAIVDPAAGCTLATLVSLGSVVTDDAIAYLNFKSNARGQSPVFRLSLPPLPRLSSTTTVSP
ncbi:uncharacterized protein BYT42DRAFT_584729 [Radiomyces spectabilis]|uniref:uncharacterized protein n=1 Tax=Radiomyces spectabilis TaxID=64574 RepID=UPI00221F37B3|nr:uncharacterized protein BYT42DRAFT_584729 [Radiomyces spectabilis]KAI8369514.1 hypothetical protein BYT42DRAFT_584729 [Radiomyces spectabilis]